MDTTSTTRTQTTSPRSSGRRMEPPPPSAARGAASSAARLPSLHLRLLVVVVVLLMATVASGATVRSCTSDSECAAAPGTYCYDTGVCVPCLQCVRYERLPPPGRCARSKHDCGPCLPGKVAETNIDGTLSVCVATETAAGSVASSTAGPGEAGAPPSGPSALLLGLGGLTMAGVVVAAVVFQRRGCECPRLLQRLAPCRRAMEPPPFYTEKPSAPPYSAQPPPPATPPLRRQVFRPAEADRPVAASPCAPPDWVRGGSLAPAEHQALLTPTATGPGPLHDDDEATQPSLWTPAPDTSEPTAGAVQGPTTFTNALRDLSISQPESGPPPPPPQGSATPSTPPPHVIHITNVNVLQLSNVNSHSC